MPIYEYQCSGCQHTFDLMQKMNDEPIKKCPQCQENSVVRLISAAAFQLKGTGWYATDFKNKGKPENKSDTANAASEKSGSDKKTTTTPTTTETTSSSNTNKGAKD